MVKKKKKAETTQEFRDRLAAKSHGLSVEDYILARKLYADQRFSEHITKKGKK